MTTQLRQEDLVDIQAIVGTGFTQLRHGGYLLLRLRDEPDAPARAREWIGRLLDDGLLMGVGDVRRGAADFAPKQKIDEILTLAFSHAGLVALGLEEDEAQPFPSAFRDGMASDVRRTLLGDGLEEPWRWGDAGNAARHILVACFRADGTPPSPWLDAGCLRDHGLDGLAVPTCPSYIGERSKGDATSVEPFGFRDGLSQPVLRELPRSTAEQDASVLAGDAFEDRVVATGEFVLGHSNEYREPSYCPGVVWAGGRVASGQAAFGRNGSYLAARQIEQHVAAFHAFTEASGVPDMAERIVGRRRDGTALAGSADPDAELDAFRYRAADADGFMCPRGAHVRRANPRDGLSADVESGVSAARLHRLLRRGRVYTEGCTADEGRCGDPENRQGAACGGGCGKGLMFVALNADLDRQFEFVQRSWINGPRFGDLRGEVDPLLGPAGRSFSIQGLPMGQRVASLPRFTTVRGGGYFFVPGLAALRFLARGPAGPAGSGA